MTCEHLNTIFHHVRGKHKQPFTKDIIGKKVSKLGSIAELRAFYGSCLRVCTYFVYYCSVLYTLAYTQLLSQPYIPLQLPSAETRTE
jgi:hypothetical protein